MKTIIFVIAALTLIGCNSAPKADSAATSAATSAGASGQASAVKQYPMHGKVLSVDTAAKSAKIDAGPIGDWMGAMTMDYPVKDPADLAKLTTGTTFDATVYVDGDNFWVGDVKPVK